MVDDWDEAMERARKTAKLAAEVATDNPRDPKKFQASLRAQLRLYRLAHMRLVEGHPDR